MKDNIQIVYFDKHGNKQNYPDNAVVAEIYYYSADGNLEKIDYYKHLKPKDNKDKTLSV